MAEAFGVAGQPNVTAPHLDSTDSSGLCQRRKHVPGGRCLLIDPFVSLPMASPWWNRSGIVIVSYQVPSSEFADNLSLPGRDRMDNLLKAHT